LSNTNEYDEDEIVFSHEVVERSGRSNITPPPVIEIFECPYCGYRWFPRNPTPRIVIQCPSCLKRFKNISTPRIELLKSDLHSAFESLKKKYPEFSGSLEIARFISIHIIKSNLNSLNSDLFIQKFLELIKNQNSKA
jgi:DNA-directed RNA polymerase subunit RPC12/RpoP